MKKLLLLVVAVFISNMILTSQILCGTDVYNQYLFSLDSNYLKEYQKQDEEIENGRSTESCPNLKIKVVFHVVYNPSYPEQMISLSRINEAINILNQDYNRTNPDAIYTGNGGYYDVYSPFPPGYTTNFFDYDNLAANVGIEFCLGAVTYDITGNTGFTCGSTSSYGNYNEGYDAVSVKAAFPHAEYSSNNYLKVWVCNLTDFVGYATFPGAPDAFDGVTVRYTAIGENDQMLKRCLTHEAGHWFGLRHIWGDANCGNDQVSDTYPMPFPSNPDPSCALYGVYCPSFNAGFTYVPMFDNFMDYSSGNCQNFFSVGQKNRMESYIDTYRSNLCVISTGSTCQEIGIEDEGDINAFTFINLNNIIYIQQVSGGLDECMVELFDIRGRAIMSKTINANEGVDVNGLPAAMYVLRIQILNTNKFYTYKFNKI